MYRYTINEPTPNSMFPYKLKKEVDLNNLNEKLDLIHKLGILEDLVDFEKEKERLEKEKKRLEGELERSNKMLSNEKFVSKAPAEKIAEEKEKLAKYTQMMAQVEERLAQLINK